MANPIQTLKRVSGFGLGLFLDQDNIYHPQDYLDITTLSRQLGTPIGDKFVDLVIPVDDNTFNEDIEGLKDTLRLRLEDPLINISRTRNIIKTSINGLNGEIIEFMSNGNYEFTLKGVITSDKIWEYNWIEINSLLQMCSYGDKALKLESELFNTFYNITDAVITDFRLQPQANMSNVIEYDIALVDDKNQNIFLENV